MPTWRAGGRAGREAFGRFTTWQDSLPGAAMTHSARSRSRFDWGGPPTRHISCVSHTADERSGPVGRGRCGTTVCPWESCQVRWSWGPLSRGRAAGRLAAPGPPAPGPPAHPAASPPCHAGPRRATRRFAVRRAGSAYPDGFGPALCDGSGVGHGTGSVPGSEKTPAAIARILASRGSCELPY